MKIFVLCLLYTGVISWFEGEICVMNDPKLGGGVCKKIQNCFYAKKLLRDSISPQLCNSRKKKQLLVCCPNTKQYSPVKISIQKCQEYSHKKFDVGIVGGVKAKMYEFPHMASIGYGMENVTWACGGSLISEQFILTAAHCALPQSYGSPTWVRLGELDFNNKNNDYLIDLKIEQKFVHPEYLFVQHYNDIALFKLSKKVEISYQIRPACLYTEKHFHKKVQAIGWGKTNYQNQIGSHHLLKTDLNIIRNRICSHKYSKGRRLPRGLNTTTQICAGDPTGKDTCQGDSGGPLQFLHDLPDASIFYIVGITSFGKVCGIGHSYGVYTKVSSFIPWIEEIVWKPN